MTPLNFQCLLSRQLKWKIVCEGKVWKIPSFSEKKQWETWRHSCSYKHRCDLTDVLATHKFALQAKSVQWNRKIQCGNSC